MKKCATYLCDSLNHFSPKTMAGQPKASWAGAHAHKEDNSGKEPLFLVLGPRCAFSSALHQNPFHEPVHCAARHEVGYFS